MSRYDGKTHPRPDRNGPRAVGDGGAVERVATPFGVDHDAETRVAVERRDLALVGRNERSPGVGGDRPGTGVGGAQWTIFASGNSRMSEAPRSFSSGMSTLMVDFGTTVSMA